MATKAQLNKLLDEGVELSKRVLRGEDCAYIPGRPIWEQPLLYQAFQNWTIKVNIVRSG